jgi:hypothetical protein
MRRGKEPPTAKQVTFLRALCREFDVPYTAPASLGAAKTQITSLLRRREVASAQHRYLDAMAAWRADRDE